MLRRRPVLAVAALAALATAVGTAAAGAPAAAPSGLPRVASGHRPGPDALYASAPRAPQLENTGPWKAAPLLVSGATAYRSGEFLYQDFLLDDHGATGVHDPDDPYGPSAHLYSPPAGTYTYPTDPVYAHNAADLVELRVKALPTATAFRITLDTLQDAARTGATIALGDGPAAAWPHGAGVSSPSALFLTWHGGTAELLDAAGGVVGPVTSAVDLTRRQVELRVPHSTWDPGRGTVRTTVGVGLWDPAAGTYLAPRPGSATATTPGGGTPQGVAIVNVGPRTDEPMPEIFGATMADTAAGGAVTAPWWRERQQSLQLSQGDLTPFAAAVDFAALVAGRTDESGVPTTGPLNRVFASRYSSGQGLDPSKVCFDLAAGFDAGASCVGRQVGQLQAYSLYVPDKPEPAKGFGHDAAAALAVGELQPVHRQQEPVPARRPRRRLPRAHPQRPRPGRLLRRAGRDRHLRGVGRRRAALPARRRLDRGERLLDGRLRHVPHARPLARPVRAGFSVVGAPGSVADQLASLRNTPLLGLERHRRRAGQPQHHARHRRRAHGRRRAVRGGPVRHRRPPHPRGQRRVRPGRRVPGQHRVVRDPFHVTYVVDPLEDSAGSAVVGDHAYWLSGLTVAPGATGTIDAVTRAKGLADGAVLPVATSAGVLTGGEIPAMAYGSSTRTWGAPVPAAPADALVITSTGVRTATVDLQRAGLTCRAAVTGTSDVPLDVVLGRCGRTVHLGPVA